MRCVITFALLSAVIIGSASSAAFQKNFLNLEPVVDYNLDLQSVSQPIEGRITNGQIAVRKQFPYQAGLRINVEGGAAWCGGSVLTNRYILTAAHCTDSVTTGLDVYLGAWDITDMSDKHMQIIFVPPKYVKVHENWTPVPPSNDVSLVRTPVQIYFNDYIQPINLPALGSNEEYVDQIAIASGWGLISDSATAVTDKLRFIEVEIMKRSVCSRYFFGQVKDSMICIRTGAAHTSICSGDSGGPLVTSDGSRTLIGLTSFGSALGCEIGFPGVFTRISSFNEWIRKHAQIES